VAEGVGLCDFVAEGVGLCDLEADGAVPTVAELVLRCSKTAEDQNVNEC
jgi:hypothetical protein